MDKNRWIIDKSNEKNERKACIKHEKWSVTGGKKHGLCKLQYQTVLSVSCKKQIYPKLLSKINEVGDVQQWSTEGTGGVIQKERDLVTAPLFSSPCI